MAEPQIWIVQTDAWVVHSTNINAAFVQMDNFPIGSNHLTYSWRHEPTPAINLADELADLRALFRPVLVRAPQFQAPVVDDREELDVAQHIVAEKALQERVAQLTPTVQELAEVTRAVSKVYGAVLSIINAGFDMYRDSVYVDSVHLVGSLPMGTMLRGERVADLIVILKSIPVPCIVKVLLKMIMHRLDLLSVFDPNEHYIGAFNERYAEIQEYSTGNRVLLRFSHSSETFYGQLERRHFGRNQMSNTYNLDSIQHVKWFGFNGQDNCTVISLIRLLKDLSNRFLAFRPLSPWMATVLANEAGENTTAAAHPLYRALEFALEIMGNGIFDPDFNNLPDPIDPIWELQRGVREDHLERIRQFANELCIQLYTEQYGDQHRETVLKRMIGLTGQ